MYRLQEFMAGFSQITLKLKEMYQMITLGGDAELELVVCLHAHTFEYMQALAHTRTRTGLPHTALHPFSHVLNHVKTKRAHTPTGQTPQPALSIISTLHVS